MAFDIITMVLYLVCFALLHSLLASLPVKRLAWRQMGDLTDKVYMPMFNLIAMISIAPLIVMVVQNPGDVIYIVPWPWMMLMIIGQAFAAFLSIRAFTDAPHRFKISLQLSLPTTEKRPHLEPSGVYRWIRDPFLLSGLCLIWLTPFMTTHILILYSCASIYLFIGSLLWEKRLEIQFEDEYDGYRAHVPRFIPWKGRIITAK